ncbi:hypothetical protein L1987_36681 [Smallanthus sonchifolius]|uniref:Uncharacterized protein n=1 Tax=Smallanthus sonchifolius TaxID=185202 RepID=A0ACB9HFH8_9ASTR|nr:hypothetical protein L1987_36681 [Smallanthus sonchifolius]
MKNIKPRLDDMAHVDPFDDLLGQGLKLLCDVSFIRWIALKERDPGRAICFRFDLESIDVCMTCFFRNETCKKVNYAVKEMQHSLLCLCSHRDNPHDSKECIRKVLKKSAYKPFILASFDKRFYMEMQKNESIPIMIVSCGKVIVLAPIKSHKRKAKLAKEQRIGLVFSATGLHKRKCLADAFLCYGAHHNE